MLLTIHTKRLLSLAFFLVFSVVVATADILDASNVVCPVSGLTVARQSVNGKDYVRRYTEISGLALSTTQRAPGTNNTIMYVINDGRDDSGGRIGVYDSGTGERLITLIIPNTTLPSSYDWEAMAIGSCGHTRDISRMCLYVADTGDNVARHSRGRRSDRTENDPYRIIKLKEPHIHTLPLDKDNVTIPILSILPFDYRHASSPTNFADCEAIFVDPTGWGAGGAIGDLYVVTKWSSDYQNRTRLFHIPAVAWVGERQDEDKVMPLYSPIVIGSYNPPKTGGPLGTILKHTWTGADITRDGTVIALSDYYGTSLFLRCPGARVAEALTGTTQSCHRFYHPSSGQVETSAFNADGTKLLQIPEGSRPVMGWTTLLYQNHDIFLQAVSRSGTLHVCPKLEWVNWGEDEMYCRSKSDLSIKPDEWCYYSPYELDVVYEEVNPQPEKPAEGSNNATSAGGGFSSGNSASDTTSTGGGISSDSSDTAGGASSSSGASTGTSSGASTSSGDIDSGGSSSVSFTAGNSSIGVEQSTGIPVEDFLDSADTGADESNSKTWSSGQSSLLIASLVSLICTWAATSA
ncbi:expressed unknown protein [Seminavis robusta]|uniref:Uncharacterized protein n=1 Tax=Seminavis robusta TaxID=568900 RepID=A0A9N8E1F9_9STRA|nr:expressed unknown protein [Seminavis robusta]|eukprot:Sro555_g165740.1 n/a (576) ;mRNA; r:41472-43199